MPQRPVPKYWRERVFVHLGNAEANSERISDSKIHVALQGEAKRLRKDEGPDKLILATSVPSPRTIGRIRQEEWPNIDADQKRQYRLLSWPESMVRGDLPWAASPTCLELLVKVERLPGMDWRPSVRAARWFWHVTQAAVDAPFADRMQMAAILMVAESVGNTEWPRAIQWLLGFAPWRSENNFELYTKATDKEREWEPLPKYPSADELVYNHEKVGLDDVEFLTVCNLMQLAMEGKHEGPY